jgi:hypothetical protein
MPNYEQDPGALAAREKLHKLAGLMSGMSAGLHCVKCARDMSVAIKCVADVDKLLEEAGEVLVELRGILHEQCRNEV